MNDTRTYRYFVTSDLHYLSRGLYDEGPAFQQMMKKNDGKLTERGDEIMNSFIRQVKEEKPDGVIIAGDLTFNGELRSLKDIAAVLREIQEAGIPVYVISGNHDIDHPDARCYHGSTVSSAEKTDVSAFLRLCGEFGRDTAASKDEATGSYLAKLQDHLYLLALDANMPFSRETIPASSLRWAEKALGELDGRDTVIGLTHQNLLKQNAMMNREIRNYKEVLGIYEKYGIRLNLSGHAHLQHIARNNGLTDICTECLMIDPLQFGILTIQPEGYRFRYENRTLGILAEEAETRLRKTVERMTEKDRTRRGIPDSAGKMMADTAYEISAAVFAGRQPEVKRITESEGWKYWQACAGGSFWYRFLANILKND